MAQIEFANVTKSFPGAAQPAVNGVSFTVHEGAICMLLGTSGSGKTTLLRMVNRLADPSDGQVLIDGRPTTDQDAIELRRKIGYVIQQVGLFPHLTVEENVRVVPSILGAKASETSGRVDELLHLVGLEPEQYRKRFPRQLSGGQQQRVGLARALAADPPLLLMDEPFGALDAITRTRMQDELLRIQRGVKKTILFVSHDVEEALKLGDQIAVMHDGKLLQVGTPVALLSAPADESVRQLVGADNILRQLEYLPVTLAITAGDHLSGASIGAESSLLHALLTLIQTGASALTVERDGSLIGQVTLSSIYSGLQASRQAAGEPQAADSAALGR